MSTPTVSVSLFVFGGSAVCVAAREVALEDRVVRDFGACLNPLAFAARELLRGEVIEPVIEVKVNYTSLWMRDNYTRVYSTLVGHLSSKMPTSRSIGVIEDHVQTVLTRFVERDTLAPFLREGREVKMSVLRVWAYQSASTEIRRLGVDASTRTTRGAKTAREVLAGNSWRVVQSAAPAREIVRDREDAGSHNDLHDPGEVSPEDALDRKSRVDMIRRHLSLLGKTHLITAVDHLLEGGSLLDLQSGTADQLTNILKGLRS